MAAIVSNDYLNGFSFVPYEQFSFVETTLESVLIVPFHHEQTRKKRGKHKQKHVLKFFMLNKTHVSLQRLLFLLLLHMHGGKVKTRSV